MVSNANHREPFWARLFAPRMLGAVWLLIVVITILHYSTSHEHHWVHDILRRAYYLPIVVAAVAVGLWGGLLTAFVVSLAYLPHAFFFMHHFDPARGLEKGLEMVLYFVVAAVAGSLSDAERKRRMELQKSLEEQHSLTKQLVRAGRLSALGAVVAGIAHEIKNPLHSLLGTAEIVDPLIPEKSEERRMWLLHREEIARLGRVAEKFLSFAKPAPIEPTKLNLADVARRVVELVEADARQKGIALTSSIPEEEIAVLGDLDQLAQVGLNIAINAIRAIGEEGGSMQVAAGMAEDPSSREAFLRIDNSGPRIEESELEKLFDPFYSNSDSTGLGLAISSRIAEQHRGYIEAENLDEGVRFTLFLRAVEA